MVTVFEDSDGDVGIGKYQLWAKTEQGMLPARIRLSPTQLLNMMEMLCLEHTQGS